MYKKRVLAGVMVILSVALVIGTLYVLVKKSNQDQDSNQSIPTDESKNMDEDNIVEQKPEAELEKKNSLELVRDVYSLAQNGKIPQVPFIAGVTNIKEIHSQWGEPPTIDKTSIGDFLVYPDHDVTIGIKDELPFDLRSYHSGLLSIHFEEIKQELGEPNEVTYYKDDKVNQIILYYQVNTTFQLKWILPKPTEQEPNPHVHHISLVTEMKKGTNDNNSLSLDEKVGQLIFAGISGTKMNKKMNQLITKYHVGGIIFNGDNLVSPEQAVTYLNQIKQLNKGDIPLFFGVDQEGGRIAKLPGVLPNLPTNLEIGKMNDPTLSYEIGTVLGQELKAFGFNVNFAPVLDVNSNPDNPVIGDRSFSNNPEIVSKLGIQTMKGLHSQSIVSAIKHFPGHGDTHVDSHLELPKVTKTFEELNELEFVPFRQAINEGADMVMVGHILVPVIDKTYPSSMSKKIITDILRQELGFKGVVITDDFYMKAITNDYEIGEAAVQSIKAGSDIIMVAHDYNKVVQVQNAIKKAVENGEISEKRIDKSVERILEMKEKYKLSDSPTKPVNIEVLNNAIEQILSR
ncbi:beta-N-acetylhexosaminidase [Ferdinandcohnia sp. Marseille-Q9671]